MAYVAKNRVGEWSGDLEIISLANPRPDHKLVWKAICHRKQDGVECGKEREIQTGQIGEVMCCRDCAYRLRAKKNTGRTKYHWTPEMDTMIRRMHFEKAGKRRTDLPSYAEYARRLRRPKHAVIRRARALGLMVQPNEPAWSNEEIRLLQMWGWMTPAVIARRLKAAGYNRTAVGVALKRKRLRIHSGRAWLYARELAEMLGVDSHKVARWVQLGLLYGNWREFEPAETSAKSSHQGEWVFHEKAIRRFILMNPLEIDLRKVDRLWFFDIITLGKFGENYIDHDEERAMKRGAKRGFIETETNLLTDDHLDGMDDDLADFDELKKVDYSKAEVVF